MEKYIIVKGDKVTVEETITNFMNGASNIAPEFIGGPVYISNDIYAQAVKAEPITVEVAPVTAGLKVVVGTASTADFVVASGKIDPKDATATVEGVFVDAKTGAEVTPSFAIPAFTFTPGSEGAFEIKMAAFTAQADDVGEFNAVLTLKKDEAVLGKVTFPGITISAE